jgi:hypothetical protein
MIDIKKGAPFPPVAVWLQTGADQNALSGQRLQRITLLRVTLELLAKLIFRPMAVLLVGEKWLVVRQVHCAFSPPRALPSNKILSFASGSLNKKGVIKSKWT